MQSLPLFPPSLKILSVTHHDRASVCGPRGLCLDCTDVIKHSYLRLSFFSTTRNDCHCRTGRRTHCWTPTCSPSFHCCACHDRRHELRASVPFRLCLFYSRVHASTTSLLTSCFRISRGVNSWIGGGLSSEKQRFFHRSSNLILCRCFILWCGTNQLVIIMA